MELRVGRYPDQCAHGDLARAVGALNMDGLQKQLGPKWAYHLREHITLPSSLASPNPGKSSPAKGKVVHSDNSSAQAELFDFQVDGPPLAKAVPYWEDLALASPRGFEPLKRR